MLKFSSVMQYCCRNTLLASNRQTHRETERQTDRQTGRHV